MTDSLDALVYSCTYNAYGQIQTETQHQQEEHGLRVETNLRFQGQYANEETGLHYNLNRYYDPRLGRYLTADPIKLAGGLNGYQYVDGNPVSWIDPLGLFKQDKTGSENRTVILGEPELPNITPQRLDPEFTNDTWKTARIFRLVEKDGYWYTVSQDGNIYVSTKDAGHFDISRGSQSVDYAGSLRLGRRGDGRGIIREFSNDSGHYKPDPDLSHQSGLPNEVFVKHEPKK